MPYFRREGHPVVSPQAFLEFVADSMMLPWLRSPLLGDLMAGLGIRLKLFLSLGLLDLPWFFAKSKLLVDGPSDSSMRISR